MTPSGNAQVYPDPLALKQIPCISNKMFASLKSKLESLKNILEKQLYKEKRAR